MIGKDNDLMIVTVLKPQIINCNVEIRELSSIIKEYLHLLEMFKPLMNLLKEHNLLDKNCDGTWGSVYGSHLLRVLSSPEYLRICPKVTIFLLTIVNLVQKLSTNRMQHQTYWNRHCTLSLPKVINSGRDKTRSQRLHFGVQGDKIRFTWNELWQSAASFQSKCNLS